MCENLAAMVDLQNRQTDILVAHDALIDLKNTFRILDESSIESILDYSAHMLTCLLDGVPFPNQPSAPKEVSRLQRLLRR